MILQEKYRFYLAGIALGFLISFVMFIIGFVLGSQFK